MLERLSLWALNPHVAPARWLLALAAFLLAFGLRFVLHDDLPPGFPFLTFFPAVILTTFFAGLWPGIAVAVMSGLASWYYFIDPPNSFGLDGNVLLALGFYTGIVVTDITLIHLMHRALRDLGSERARCVRLAEQRKLMFHELQHRVSNNLATVSGLLQLQRRTLTDDVSRRAFGAAIARIDLVSRMQRMLHDPEAQQVDFGDFLGRMAQGMVAAAGAEDRATLDLQVCPVRVTSDQAIPLGLIATELLSNALEHAIGTSGTGHLSVSLAREGATATLRITDTGPGLPTDFDLATAGSLGLSIARQFAHQLGAKLRLEPLPDGGTVSTLQFPLTAPQEASSPAQGALLRAAAP